MVISYKELYIGILYIMYIFEIQNGMFSFK